MGTRLDKLMTHAAYLYIIIPFFIFCTGWLRWQVSLPICLILIVSYLLSIRATKEIIITDIKKHKNKIIISLVSILIVVFFSGIGEYSYQVEDHHYRNSLFHDLVTHSWPYKINETGSITPGGSSTLYIYYIQFWLPAALVGKILGWKVANFFFYLWNVAGITLTFYFICRFLKRFSLRILFAFLFFNGLYMLVSFTKYPLMSVLASDYQTWSGNMILAASTIDSLFWIFNQTVTPWLIMIMILDRIPKQNIFFLYASCYLHGPFAFLGFFPFLVIILFKNLFSEEDKNKTFIAKILPYFSVQNMIAGPIIFLTGYFFLSGSPAVEPLYIDHHLNKVKYILFITVSFAIISLLIFPKYKKEPSFYIMVLMLLGLPFICMGTIQPFTFCARVSLGPQFILMILVIKYLAEEGNTMLKKLVVTYMVLGAIEPALELGRSIAFTVGYYINPVNMNQYLLSKRSKYSSDERINMLPASSDLAKENYLILDDLETLDRPLDMYKISPPQNNNSFFQKYLIKQK